MYENSYLYTNLNAANIFHILGPFVAKEQKRQRRI